MITTCSLNGINDIRVFIEQKSSYPNASFPNSSKNYHRFTYALFTPLYTAIYSDNVKNDLYDTIFNSLLECQENCNHSFRIQEFEYLDFKDGSLTIEKELNVI